MVAAGIVIVAGGLVVLVGLMGWLGRLPRNRLAGVRTSATLRSDRAFEVGNRVAAPAVIVGGGAAIVSGLVALLLPESDVAACVFLGVVVMAVLAIVGGVRGDRVARTVDV